MSPRGPRSWSALESFERVRVIHSAGVCGHIKEIESAVVPPKRRHSSKFMRKWSETLDKTADLDVSYGLSPKDMELVQGL